MNKKYASGNNGEGQKLMAPTAGEGGQKLGEREKLEVREKSSMTKTNKKSNKMVCSKLTVHMGHTWKEKSSE